MSLSLTGTIKKIGELQTFNSGFQKKELVLLTSEAYPQPINIEFLSEAIDRLDNYKVGDQVTVHLNLRGREWSSPQGEVKYFNSITGWKIENAGSVEAISTNHTATPEEAFPKESNVFAEDDDSDELPF